MIEHLNTLASTGAAVQQILQRLETLGVQHPKGHGSQCLALLWYNGPYSKGGSSNLTRHSTVDLDFQGTGHDKMEAQILVKDLVPAEKAFFKAAKAFTKAMAGAPSLRAIKAYPAFRFELYPSGGHVSYDLKKDSPSNTFAGIEDFLFPNHWDVFANAMATLYGLEGIGEGETYCVGKRTHTPLNRGAFTFSETYSVQATTLKAAHTFGTIAYIPSALIRNADVCTFKVETPALDLVYPDIIGWQGSHNPSRDPISIEAPF